MGRGYIKLHRELLESPIFEHDGLLRLWTYCLMRANWQDVKRLIPGTTREITIARGSFLTGRHSLHAALYPADKKDLRELQTPSASSLWRWVKSLESMGCLTTQIVDNRCTLITICNYSTYQSPDEEMRTADEQPVNSRCPAGEPPVNTEEELKELKETKKPRTNTPAVTVAEVTFPNAMDTTEVRDSLAEWLDYKRVRGEGYKRASFVNHLLQDFSRFGPAAFCQAVSKSIGSNYMGLVEPKGSPNGQQRINPGNTHPNDTGSARGVM